MEYEQNRPDFEEPAEDSPLEERAAEIGPGVDEALKRAQEEATDYLDRLRRTQADFVNYKRRIEQERSDFVKQAEADLMVAILPVMDDLDRALESVPEDVKDHSWTSGIRHISRKLRSTLEARGLKRIEAIGKEFNPNYHESAALAEGKEDVIVDEIKPGYQLHDRVIRPSSVIVGRGGELPPGHIRHKKTKKNNE